MKRFYLTILTLCMSVIFAFAQADYADMYTVDATGAPGGQTKVSINIENTENSVAGFSCKIHLPEGFTVEQASRGSRLMGKNSGGEYNTTFQSQIQADGSYMLLAYGGVPFPETDGEVATLTINIPADASLGDYDIELREIETSVGSSIMQTRTEYTGKLTVEELSFEEGYSLMIPPFEFNDDVEFNFTLSNITDIADVAFDVLLPSEIVDNELFDVAKITGTKFTFDTDEVGNGIHVSLVHKNSNKFAIGTANEVAKLEIGFDDTLIPEGIYEIELKNITLTTTTGENIKVAPYKASILVGNPTLSGNVKLYGKYTTDEYAIIETVVANDGASVTCEDVVLADGKCFMTTNNFGAENISYNAAVSPTLGYRTIVLPYSVDVPAEFEAYTVNSVVNNELNMTQVNTIPENTPAILKNAGTAVINANNVTVVATADAELSNGELVGTYSEIDAPVGSYVLQNQGGNVAFYNVQSTQPKVPAFRAYIKSQDSGARFMNIVTDGQATGIMNVESGEMMDVKSIHTVDGVRRSALSNGINIVRTDNGVKKVIINN